MTTSQASHWDYTVNEWSRAPFTRIIEELPDNLKRIWDIGANVGGFTHILQRKYPKAVFHCFEPVKANYEYLTEHVKAHHHRYGIYYGARTSRVVSRGDGNVGGIFIEQLDAGEPRVFADEVIKLKTFEELDLADPDLIKFDIEGAEENVLEHSLLVKRTPWLIVEWHPPTDPHAFFKKHLPNHRIVVNLEDKQFLLCFSPS